jgi:serine/threonine protein kinase
LCYRKGVIHCDLKPVNVRVDRGRRVALTDFRMATHIGRRPLTNQTGTLWYRAPELPLGARECGAAVDL